ncbi:uncharacterized protein F4812DRAFT_219512 [Daldinia caldariorum]|uniref:uncharacterized protein n=1 Tax=Daldinia caldariorum TaxID=326644 RepID=UPI002007FCAD|nr:uncharacterized protein F4812DRAFT_219512 [Daldinia caldariorum]KAI1464010.1 hypothetical protein F4812DRAFT_219512 [Daldinia caldariorum]
MLKRKSAELEESQSEAPGPHQPHKRSRPDAIEEDIEMGDATGDSEQLDTPACGWTGQCMEWVDYSGHFKDIYPEEMLKALGTLSSRDEWLGPPPPALPNGNERTDAVFIVAHSTVGQTSWGNAAAAGSARLVIEGTYRSLEAANLRAMQVYYEARARGPAGWERPRPETVIDPETRRAGKRSWYVDGEGLLTLRFTEANLVDGCEVCVTKQWVS